MINENSNSGQKIEYIIKNTKKVSNPTIEKQKKYVRALKESEIIISTGPWNGKNFSSRCCCINYAFRKD